MKTYALAASAFTEGLTRFGNGLIDFFTGFTVTYAAEILLFYLLIYYVSKVLRDNDATRLMLLYWALLVVVGVVQFSTSLSDTDFYLYFVLLLSLFMLILFNVEIKKSLWDVHNPRKEKAEKVVSGSENRTSADVERCISDIIKALQNMSKNNVGALIILSKGNLPKQVLQSGVMLDAEISTQLIEGIFFPKAPLHDGAMVIRGHKIQAAGCFLPLTQKTSYPKEFGTRHRAGIGITEVANVVSLVVSEETGIISMARDGKLTRYLDTKSLNILLTELFLPDDLPPAWLSSHSSLFGARDKKQKEDSDEK